MGSGVYCISSRSVERIKKAVSVALSQPFFLFHNVKVASAAILRFEMQQYEKVFPLGAGAGHQRTLPCTVPHRREHQGRRQKVIVAVNLKISKLQNKTIWLQNAQKVVENTISKLKLTEINDWVTKQRDLYKDYFEELKRSSRRLK